jgi:phosphoribosylformimino-5-aminoimidazole carboxamide ribotide isomerase
VSGIDSRHGKVAVHGWQDVSEVKTLALAHKVATVRVAAIIYTDITRDGMLLGPNIASIAEVARQVHVPIIASGGIASLEDLRRLAALQQLGVSGVMIDKALYEGQIEYQQACAAVQA